MAHANTPSRGAHWLHSARLLAHIQGVLLLVLAVAMLPSALLAGFDHGPDQRGLFWATLITFGSGLILRGLTPGVPRNLELHHREGFLIAGTSWITAGLVGALPFWLYAQLAPDGICLTGAGRPPIGVEFCTLTNAMFESVSGFTTTGASILSDGLWTEVGIAGDRPGLPRGILLWRSMTHYLGGIGIIVLGVALLPLLGIGGMELYRAEAPGPTKDKIAPRIRETARLLWKIYILLSLVLLILLLFGGMNGFEAICHTMATMATGGFSTRSTSVAGFDSGYIEWVLVLFMFIAGTNFTLHYLTGRGDWWAVVRDAEWRTYAGLTLVCVGLVFVALMFSGQGFAVTEAARIAAFQVVSILTTTGYASHDFEAWTYAPAAVVVLMLLMFSGGMAGSTAGGVKIVRHMVLARMWARELFFLAHPKAIKPVRLNGHPIPPAVVRSIASFIAVYMLLIAGGTVLFSLDGHDPATAFTAAASALGNVGPGLSEIGPMDNWATLGVGAKWLAAFMMLLGRLELYTLLVLLSPYFWRR